MAIEFNITATSEFFLGEDKEIAWQIFGPDDATPIDITGWPLIFTLSKTDKSAALITKAPGSGLSISGSFNSDPGVNAQRVVVVFSPSDTSVLKANFEYRYRVRRTDSGSIGVLAFGSIVFLQ